VGNEERERDGMKGRKEERKKERKKERKERRNKKRKNISINSICYIKKPYEQIYENFILESVTCAMLTSS
jgi:hypothetical protein